MFTTVDARLIYRRLPLRLATLLSPPPTGLPRDFPPENILPVLDHRVDSPVWDWAIRTAHSAPPVSEPARFPTEPTPADQNPARSQIAAGLDLAAAEEPPRAPPRLCPQRPSAGRDWLLRHLQAYAPGDRPGSSGDPATATALRAGVLQWHDYLDESHQLSQSIEGDGPHLLGDYWHAIMHRREPDFANSKYWFQHVGPQPVFEPLAAEADAILRGSAATQAGAWRDRLLRGGRWDPFAFVDLCASCADEDSDLAQAARRVQLAELWLLLEFTWRTWAGE